MDTSISTSQLTKIGLFAALIGIGAFVSIPIGPVAITMQSLFVLLSGYFLKNKAHFSSLIYVITGLIGIPVFAGFNGGLSYVFAPSFGFLLGMIIISYYLGRKFNELDGLSFKIALITYLKATFLLYLIGLPFMAFILNVYMGNDFGLQFILVNGMLMFIPGDIVKAIIAAKVVSQIERNKL